MALSNPPSHLSELLENMDEVLQLLEIHKSLTGTSPGRRHDVEVLNKSAVVLVVACWEAYVEDLAKSALEYMMENAKDHTVFPTIVLERVASSNQGVKAWKLAGNGWKKALKSNLTEILAKTTGALNTPKTAQVNELFKKSIGLPQLSSCWKWSGRSSKQVETSLDDLVTLRGGIAHRVKHSKSVHKKTVQDAIELVSRMAAKSNNVVGEFVKEQVGSYPWNRVTYKGLG